MRTRSLNTIAGTALLTLSTGVLPAAVFAQEGSAEGPAVTTGGFASAEPTVQTPTPGPGAAPTAGTGSAPNTGGITGPAGTGLISGGPGAPGTTTASPPTGYSGAPGTGPASTGGIGSGLMMGGMYGFPGGGPSDNLANLLGSAMSRNPDISVAEGKVRAAQSELDRTRLDVSRQVVEAFQSVRYSRKAVEIAKAQVAQTKEQQSYLKQMHKEGAAAASDVAAADVTAREAELALIKSEAQLESTIATLDYLAGGSAMPGGGMMPGMGGYPGMAPGAAGPGPMGSAPHGRFPVSDSPGGATDAGASAAGGLDAGTAASPSEGGIGGAGTSTVPGGPSGSGEASGARGGLSRTAVVWAAKTHGSTFHERLRSKLEEPTTLDFPEAPLSDIMRYIDDVHGITNIIIDEKAPDGRDLLSTTIRLKLDKVPLSAALKAIEDMANVHFVVTDYGLRLTTKDKAADIEDSTSLRQFLRQSAITGAWYFQKATGSAEGASAAEYNPFASGAEGNPASGSTKPEGAEQLLGGADGAEGTAAEKR